MAQANDRGRARARHRVRKQEACSPICCIDCEPCCGAEAASLFYALAYVALWGGVVWIMYRKRVFIGI